MRKFDPTKEDTAVPRPWPHTDLLSIRNAIFLGGIEMTLDEVLSISPLPLDKGYRATGYGNITVFDLGAFADIETHYVIEFVDPDLGVFHTIIATLVEWWEHFGCRPDQHYTAHVVGYRSAEEVSDLTPLERGLILPNYVEEMDPYRRTTVNKPYTQCHFCTQKATMLAPQDDSSKGAVPGSLFRWLPVCPDHADGWFDGSDFPNGVGAPPLVAIPEITK